MAVDDLNEYHESNSLQPYYFFVHLRLCWSYYRFSPYDFWILILFIVFLCFLVFFVTDLAFLFTVVGSDVCAGLSKGVGFIRFDQRHEAERAINKLNNTIPDGCVEQITVKFANNPSNNPKAIPPLAAYLSPQRRFAGPIHHPTGRFRYIPLSPASRYLNTSFLLIRPS